MPTLVDRVRHALPGMDRRLFMAGGLALLGACAKGGDAVDTIRIGFQKGGLLYLAKARGDFDKRLAAKGISVRWLEFPSGPPLLEAIRADAADFGHAGGGPPIFAQANGSPLVYVGVQPTGGVKGALLVAGNSPIRSVADLRGKRIVYNRGGGEFTMATALAPAGLKLSDITSLHLAPADAAAAFGKGAIDGWLTWDPYYALAEYNHKARVLLTGAALGSNNGYFFATRQFADQRGATLKQVVDELHREAAWGNGHADEAGALVFSTLNLPEPVRQRIMRRDPTPFAIEPMLPKDVADQQQIADGLNALGLLPRSVDIKSSVWNG